MSPPAATAVAVTQRKRAEMLCCVRLNQTIPSSKPLFRLLGRQYIGLSFEVQISYTPFVCVYVWACVCVWYMCPSRLLPLISQCQGGAHNMTQSHISHSSGKWQSVSLCKAGKKRHLHAQTFVPEAISLFPQLLFINALCKSTCFMCMLHIINDMTAED